MLTTYLNRFFILLFIFSKFTACLLRWNKTNIWYRLIHNLVTLWHNNNFTQILITDIPASQPDPNLISVNVYVQIFCRFNKMSQRLPNQNVNLYLVSLAESESAIVYLFLQNFFHLIVASLKAGLLFKIQCMDTVLMSISLIVV